MKYTQDQWKAFEDKLRAGMGVVQAGAECGIAKGSAAGHATQFFKDNPDVKASRRKPKPKRKPKKTKRIHTPDGVFVEDASPPPTKAHDAPPSPPPSVSDVAPQAEPPAPSELTRIADALEALAARHTEERASTEHLRALLGHISITLDGILKCIQNLPPPASIDVPEPSSNGNHERTPELQKEIAEYTAQAERENEEERISYRRITPEEYEEARDWLEQFDFEEYDELE